jgi:23S rRNA (adenine2503-C2)-methyltransferase
MKVVASTGREDIAVVYVGEFDDGKCVEFVEALSPPKPRHQKWVLLLSTLYGCPVGCQMCDAGGYYHGTVSKDDLFAQIDYMVRKRYPDGAVPSQQFKIQFARMGEPSFNPAVLDILEELPSRYHAPGFMPSISTIAPNGTDRFFDRLARIKQHMYSGGNFQMQFSIHTTDEELRDEVIPVKKWGFARIAEYGEQFYEVGDRKVTLNFALAEDMPVDPTILKQYFDPALFLVKITPLNPTYRARDHGLTSYIDPNRDVNGYKVVDDLREAGYQVIVSIGEMEENYIGSNCGQYVRKHLEASERITLGYTYPLYGK